MVMTKKISSTQGVTCPSATSCSKNRTWTFWSWNQGLTVRTDCLSYGATTHVFNYSMSLGFEIQLQLRPEEFYIYSTLKCIHGYTVCQGQHQKFNIFYHSWKELDFIHGLFFFVCKWFPCCSLDICLHRTTSLKDVFSSFGEISHRGSYVWKVYQWAIS
jgi:TRAP-type mannitol/chloroaromatic compound transport system permease small subunit